jgi:hypothetical protein
MAARVSCISRRASGEDHEGFVVSAVGSNESVRAYAAKLKRIIISGAARNLGLARH